MKAILRLTIAEQIRRKTFAVFGAVTALYLVLWGVLLYNYMGSSVLADSAMVEAGGGQVEPLTSMLMLQMSLQFSSSLICLLAIMTGAGMISSDVDSGVVLGIMARPIARRSYVLGRFGGVLVLVAAFATALYALVLALGAAFSLSTVTSLGAGQLMRGWLLYVSVPAAILCLTAFGSTVFKTVANGVVMVFFYILGNVGGMVETIGMYLDDANVNAAGVFISLVSPFHTLFGAAERSLLPSAGIAGDVAAASSGLSGGGQPSAWMYLYIAVYVSAFLALAVRRFARRDITA
ncbi:MAG: ABC transporter permease [Bifidobacteriaceae bacterium]|jgi:ABC-type transport system involved in multi-copper enzyme maturation permease subunit|nr:ABC transporter permease [Bifidobacteriaceae bacterium]